MRMIRPLVTFTAVLAFVVACHRDGSPARGAKPSIPNVLLVTIDTLRADAVGAYGSAEARTPALDRLAREGVRFDAAFAPAPITLASHASMLTGLYPPGHGARDNGIPMRSDVPTIAELMQHAGFSTAAFVSAFPLDHRFGLARGFQTYSDRLPRGADGKLRNERRGAETADEAIAWLDLHRAQKFFLWVHFFEPHAPYGDPASGRTARERYADEVREADRQAGRVIDALGPARPETVIVAAGDHGEAFGEHGEITHSLFVYDTTLRVPLIVAGPGITANVRVVDPVSLVDVAPTILAVAGVRARPGERLPEMDGVPLAIFGDDSHSRPLYAESFTPLFDFGWSSLRSIRNPATHMKYIAAPRPELYDLQHDPGETRNLADIDKDVAARMARQVAQYSGPELPARAGASVDPAARARLQGLGYTSGSSSGVAAARRDPKDGRELAAKIAEVASGELEGAGLERTLVAILREDPRNPQANVRLAYVRLQSGRCRDAEPLFARAIANHLPGSDALMGLAMCEGARGDLAAAERHLTEADRREPDNPVVLANLGIARSKLGNAAGAIDALERALAIDPGLDEARFNLALAFARAGRVDEARTTARGLLDRLPPSAPQRSEVERFLQSLPH